MIVENAKQHIATAVKTETQLPYVEVNPRIVSSAPAAAPYETGIPLQRITSAVRVQMTMVSVNTSKIIGWGLYGARCCEFLFSSSRTTKPFMVLYSLVAILGATVDLGLLWNIAETFNGLMAIPNLIAVFLLSGVVVKLVKEYFTTGDGKDA